MAKLVRGIIREGKLMTVVAALEDAGVTGMTVTRGIGRGRNVSYSTYRGVRYRTLVQVGVIEVIVSEAAVDEVVRIMLEHGRTGEPGDGHVLVMDIGDCYAIKTRWRAVA